MSDYDPDPWTEEDKHEEPYDEEDKPKEPYEEEDKPELAVEEPCCARTPRGEKAAKDPATPSTAPSTGRHSPASSQKTKAPGMKTPRKIFEVPKPMGHSVMNLSTMPNSPRYSFQPPHRTQPDVNIPGPGAHVHDGKARRSPAYAMTSRPTPRSPHMQPPTPSFYDIPSSFGTGRQSSLGPSRPTQYASHPGPGSYEIKSTLGQVPNFTVAVPRAAATGNGIPGPGAYENTSAPSTPRYTMRPSAERGKGKRHQHSPGPHAYMIPAHLGTGKTFSHGLRRNERPEVTPGPGHYGGHYSTFHVALS